MPRICSLSVERPNLSEYIRGAYTISKPQIVYALCTKLSSSSWSHYRKIIFIGYGLSRLIDQDMKFRPWPLPRVVERSFGW